MSQLTGGRGTIVGRLGEDGWFFFLSPGTVTVDIPSGRSLNLDEYDARIETLLDYLSLANGRLLRWSVREHYVPRGQVHISCRGKHSDAGNGWPLFPYLHLRPAVEAALKNITVEEHRRLGLHVATSWALLNSQFAEANFHGMMTALEHLVHVGMRNGRKETLFPRNRFRSMRPQLDAAVRAELAACGFSKDDERADEFVRRIGNANHQPLGTKISAYLKDYAVPVDDLLSTLPKILALRNDVVHRGLATEYRDGAFNECVDCARELLARIFMTHLKYSGPYESFLGGHSTKQFGSAQG